MTASDIRNIIKGVVEAHITHNNWYSIWSVAKDRESVLNYPAVIWGQWTGRIGEQPNEIGGGMYLTQLVRLLIITSVGTDRTPDQRDQAIEDANAAATDFVLALNATYRDRIGNISISTQFDGYGALETGVMLTFSFRSDALCLDAGQFNPPEECPTFEELIALRNWAGIKAPMSEEQIADAVADLCDGGGPCDPLAFNVRDTLGEILYSGTQADPCGKTLDVTAPNGNVLINGDAVGIVLSAGTLDIPVLQNDVPVGALVGSEWIIPPGGCDLGIIVIMNGIEVANVTGLDPCVDNDVNLT